jgi:quinol monooxygenase YgiN
MRSLLALLIVLGAQAPTNTDTAFYTVAYVDVMPSAKAPAVAAFKQYRDASSKEPGFVRFELFEQDGREGHLSLIETWANPGAYDTHSAGAASKEWRSKIDTIRLSDYDQRPYKTLSLGPTPSSEPQILVITHVDIGGQGTNAAELLKRLAEASRKENGNIRFDVIQHTMRANHFTVIEGWRNRQAVSAHAAAPHTRQYRDGLAPIAGSPLDERIYQPLK